MHNILMIVRREYRERVRKPSFWIGTLLFPALMIGMIFAPLGLAMLESQETLRFALVDATGRLHAAADAAIAANKLKNGARQYELVADSADGAHATAAFLQHALHVRAGGAHRGCEPEHDRADDDDQRSEGQDQRIDRGLFEPRNTGRSGGSQCLHAPGRQRNPRSTRESRQEKALGQQLPDDSPTAGAERHADCQLTRAHRGSREQQVGNVAARDEQDQADRAEQREQPAPIVSDQFVHDGRDREVDFGIVLRKADPEALCIPAKLRQRLSWRRAGSQAAVVANPDIVEFKRGRAGRVGDALWIHIQWSVGQLRVRSDPLHNS